jgi:hypothetical protein
MHYIDAFNMEKHHLWENGCQQNAPRPGADSPEECAATFEKVPRLRSEAPDVRIQPPGGRHFMDVGDLNQEVPR